MKTKLTLKEFNLIKNNTVFDKGIVLNSPEEVYMTNTDLNRPMLWVAVKGNYNDWCIYIHWADNDEEYVLNYGDKVINSENIKKLISCDNDVLSLYRM